MTALSNNFADWHPLLVASGVPTPASAVIHTDIDLAPLLREVSPDGLSSLVEDVTAAAGRFGFPAFLRTGHTSGKRDFARTALVRSPHNVLPNIAALVRHSALATDEGLPTTTWVVREFLPIRPAFIAFRGLPIGAERRYYFNALGQVAGRHPMWDPAVIAGAAPRGPQGPMAAHEWGPVLDVLNREEDAEVDTLTQMTQAVADTFAGHGAWSVDYLYSHGRGWVAIDMARFEDSDVWAAHPNAPFSMRHPVPYAGEGPAGPIDAALRAQYGL
jgi:hypothetical protein